MSILNVHTFGDPDGETLVAIHGITGHGRRFRRLAEQAWPHRRTIAVDLRGHGRSLYDGPWSIHQHVTDVVDTLDSVGIALTDLIGHSYGGVIAYHLLGRAPERTRAHPSHRHARSGVRPTTRRDECRGGSGDGQDRVRVVR